MAQLWWNFGEGTTDTLLAVSGTTLSGSFLSAMPAVSGADYVVLVLDPEAAGNGPEVVHVTAHTASATTATITRAQESTSDVQHASGTKVVAPVTKAALDAIVSSVATVASDLSSHEAAGDPHTQYLTAAEGNAAYLGISATAAAATKWATGRTISLTGDVTGTSGSLDGTGNVSISAVVANDSHNHSSSSGDFTIGGDQLLFDSTDYLQYSNNAWIRHVINGVERFRVDSSGYAYLNGARYYFNGSASNDYFGHSDGSNYYVWVNDGTEMMRVTMSYGAGKIGTTVPYSFDVYRNSDQSITENTWTTLVFNTELLDVSGGYNTSNGIFTVPSGQDGYWIFGASVRMNGSLDKFQIRMMLDGATTGFCEQHTTNTEADPFLNMTFGRYLNASQNVRVQAVWQDSALSSNSTVLNNIRFWGTRVS